MTKVSKKIARKMRLFRKKKGLTQEETAYEAELDYSYYNQIENGRRNPSVEAVARIAKVLGVPVKELFS
ncbi:helix-turn-helix transcriptional regulator [Candidatus Daviesbacteria bacterium]|nr:helix-turn-helix transcriptional regulator [Candidatus Daviesbacteria bacterium]